MPRQPQQADEGFAEMPFPLKGVDLSSAYSYQQKGTTPLGINVRAYDSLGARARGGSRPGLVQYIPQQVNGLNLVQDLNSVVGVGFTPPGSTASVITVVQKAFVTTVAGSTISGAFVNPVAAGNTIVAIGIGFDTDTAAIQQAISVTDNLGNVYTRAAFATGPGTGVNPGGLVQRTSTCASIWYSPNVVGGAATVTLHLSGVTFSELQLVEINGLGSSPLAQTNSNAGTGTPVTTNPVTVGVGAIAIAVNQSFEGVDELQTMASVGAPWTTLTRVSPSSRPSECVYQIFSAATASVNPSWNAFSATNQSFSACIAVFNPMVLNAQASQSGRIVVLAAVSNGMVKVTTPGNATWSGVLNSTGQTLNTSGVVRSTSAFQKLWFADGVHYLFYDPSLNAMQVWSATQGSLPVDIAGNTPRLICTYRGRIVLSGLSFDGQNWFMSAVGDPTNWNYFPFSITPTQAVEGNNSTLGVVGDVVNTLIPYTDDMLIFGCDSSIWALRGDPMAGGQIDLVSSTIGMAWGIPWAKGPDGVLYFFSNKMGIYQMQPGQGPPTRMSQQIEQLLSSIDTGTNIIRMLWDDLWQGLHVYVTPAVNAQATNHFFWEKRTGAWWQDFFANYNHSPLCCVSFDGNTTADRHSLIGSWDGYVRTSTPVAVNDDGFDIASSVLLGPITTKNFDDILAKDMQALLAINSGAVSYAVYVGRTAEEALSNPAVASGTWFSGRNLTQLIRRSGWAIYVKITASNQWAFEALRFRIGGLGRVRARRR